MIFQSVRLAPICQKMKKSLVQLALNSFLYGTAKYLKPGFRYIPIWPLSATGTTMTVTVTPKKSTQESSSVVDFSSHAV